jgi:hypothetical protein
MKRTDANESPHSTANHPVQNHSEEPLNDWKQGDPVWDILNQASSPEPSPFFARNVVRSARQLKKESLVSRVISLFSSRRLALGAAACACAMITYQMWPAATSPDTAPTNGMTQTVAPVETTTDLTELVLEETLLAAADDPSIYTRDEVVAMLGL